MAQPANAATNAWLQAPLNLPGGPAAGWHGGRLVGQGGFGKAGVWVLGNASGNIIDRIVKKTENPSLARFTNQRDWYYHDPTDPNIPPPPPGPETADARRLRESVPAEAYCSRQTGRSMIPGRVRKTIGLRAWSKDVVQRHWNFYFDFCDFNSLDELIYKHNIRQVARRRGNRVRNVIEPKPFSEPQLWYLFLCLVEGAMAMHEPLTSRAPNDPGRRIKREVVHHDLKPDNVFLSSPDPNRFRMWPTPRIADFGGARWTRKEDPDNPWQGLYICATTQGFRPPELIRNTWDWNGYDPNTGLNCFDFDQLGVYGGPNLPVPAQVGAANTQMPLDQQGFDPNGYDLDGYDAMGYDRLNFDRDGWDRNGVKANGLRRNWRHAVVPNTMAAGGPRRGWWQQQLDPLNIDPKRRKINGLAATQLLAATNVWQIGRIMLSLMELTEDGEVDEIRYRDVVTEAIYDKDAEQLRAGSAVWRFRQQQNAAYKLAMRHYRRQTRVWNAANQAHVANPAAFQHPGPAPVQPPPPPRNPPNLPRRHNAQFLNTIPRAKWTLTISDEAKARYSQRLQTAVLDCLDPNTARRPGLVDLRRTCETALLADVDAAHLRTANVTTLPGNSPHLFLCQDVQKYRLGMAAANI